MRKTLDPIRFRSFVEGDVDLLGAWLRASGLGVPDGVAPSSWGRRLSADPLIKCRAACGSRGQVLGFYRLDLAPDHSAEITLIVDPRCRRQGVGRAMFSEILEEARQTGIKRLLAVVQEGNKPGREFFPGFGFESRPQQMPGYLHFERIIHGGGSQPPLDVSP